MSYSKLREEQEREMEDLLIERFTEIERFKKLNANSWGQPDKFNADIERTEKYYADKTSKLRQQHELAQKDFLNEVDEEPHIQDDHKPSVNPVDNSKITSRFDEPPHPETLVEEKVPEELPKEKKKFRFRKKPR